MPMKEGSPADEIEPIEHVNGEKTEAAPPGVDLSKELTPAAKAAIEELKRRHPGEAVDKGYGAQSLTQLRRLDALERQRAEQQAAVERLRPDENTVVVTSGEKQESPETEASAPVADPARDTIVVSPAFDEHERKVAEEPHWMTEEEYEARRPKPRESLTKKATRRAAKTAATAAKSAGAVAMKGGRKAVRGAMKAATASGRAFSDATDWHAETAKRVGKAVKSGTTAWADTTDFYAERAKQISQTTRETIEGVEDTVRIGAALARENMQERLDEMARENHESLMRRGEVRRASRAGKNLDDRIDEQPEQQEPETIERVLADGVAAETQRKTLEEILNSPDGAAFADLLDRKGISPDEIETNPERLHAQFEAFQAREQVTTEVHQVFEQMLSEAGAVVGAKQREAVADYIEHAVAYYPEEIARIHETLSALDKHKAQVEAYRRELAGTEREILSQMSIYVDPKTPLPENVHEIFDPGHYKQVSEISDADLDDRERTFQLALSGSQGHKGWKEPALSWAVSFITRDYPTPEEKKAIERLAYEFKADKKYSSIQDRCRAELTNIAALRELKRQHAELVKQREGTASLVREQMRRQMQGTEVWQAALFESAKETAKMVGEVAGVMPKDVNGADKFAEMLRTIDVVSSNLAFNLGSEMPMEEMRNKAAEHMKQLRARELRKVLAETAIGAGGLDAMFASVDALVASPEIGKHDTAQAIAHIYQSVEKIIPDLPDGRQFYARVVLQKLRAKYGDIVDTVVHEQSAPATAVVAAQETAAHASGAPEEVETETPGSSDTAGDVPIGYMPSGMMDDESPVQRETQRGDTGGVREPDEVLSPETTSQGHSTNIPATFEVGADSMKNPSSEQHEVTQSRDAEETPGGQETIAAQVETPQSSSQRAPEEVQTTTLPAVPEGPGPRPEAEIVIGERMKVLGPTGSIESGWVVEKMDADTGVVTLAKEGAKRRDKHSVKEIPMETLQSWQEFADRETIERTFAKVKNITELFDSFARLKGVYEGGIFYSSDKLVDLVERARMDPSKINQVPNIGKLRLEAKRMLRIEAQERERAKFLDQDVFRELLESVGAWDELEDMLSVIHGVRGTAKKWTGEELLDEAVAVEEGKLEPVQGALVNGWRKKLAELRDGTAKKYAPGEGPMAQLNAERKERQKNANPKSIGARIQEANADIVESPKTTTEGENQRTEDLRIASVDVFQSSIEQLRDPNVIVEYLNSIDQLHISDEEAYTRDQLLVSLRVAARNPATIAGMKLPDAWKSKLQELVDRGVLQHRERPLQATATERVVARDGEQGAEQKEKRTRNGRGARKEVLEEGEYLAEEYGKKLQQVRTIEELEELFKSTVHVITLKHEYSGAHLLNRWNEVKRGGSVLRMPSDIHHIHEVCDRLLRERLKQN